MATRTRTGNSAKTEIQYKSKSDFMRALFLGTDVGTHKGTHTCNQFDSAPVTGHGPTHTVSEVTRIVPKLGYAFAYGVAQRAGVAKTAANRKATKLVTVQNGVVSVRTSAGTINVHPDGKVTRTNVPAAAKAPKAKAKATTTA